MVNTDAAMEPREASRRSRKISVSLFAVAIFLSALLLFQIQPLIAKLILPWFGGAATVWTTCLMFFQLAYLAGNLYAWWLGKQTPRTQSTLHTILMAASFLILPILPKAAWKPPAGANPALYILAVLATTI